MDTYFSVERVVFEKYINELSSDAFKVLLKMLYLARRTTDDIKVRSNRSLRRIVGLDTTFANSIWNELIENHLVIKKEKDSRTVYILNGEKILQDNADYQTSKGPRAISVTVFDAKGEIRSVVELSDESLREKIESMFGEKVDADLVQSVSTTVSHLKRYYAERERKFRMSQLTEMLAGLVKHNNDIVKRACDRYNNSNKLAGNRGFRYILGIASGMCDDVKKVVDDRQEIEHVTGKRKEEGELKFAMKLVTGKAYDSHIYKKLLKADDFDKLNELWQLGFSELKSSGDQDSACKDYEWLKI